MHIGNFGSYRPQFKQANTTRRVEEKKVDERRSLEAPMESAAEKIRKENTEKYGNGISG
jgi:hypothetical protein